MATKTHSSAYSHAQSRSALPFFLLMFYLVVEYARPAFLSPIRPALIIQALLLLNLLSEKDAVSALFKEKFFKIYLFLLAFMCIHVFIAVNNYWAYKHLEMMLTYLLMSVSFCVYLNSFERLEKFITFFVFIIALAAISRIAGSSLIGGSGLMGDENDFALAMNIALPISFFLGREEKGWRKWFFLIASVLFILGNIVSQSRGGFLGLAAVGAVCWFYSENKFRTLVILALFGALAWGFAPPEFKQEITGINLKSGEKGTGKDRVELWKVGWRAFLDNPVLGVGQGNMPMVMEKYQYDEKGESFWQRGLWGRAIHSFYFTLLPELGLVGVIIFIMMLKELLQNYKKTKNICLNQGATEAARKIKSLNVAIVVSVFGFLLTAIFISVFYYPQFWNLAALNIALSLTALRTLTPTENHIGPMHKKQRRVAQGKS